MSEALRSGLRWLAVLLVPTLGLLGCGSASKSASQTTGAAQSSSAQTTANASARGCHSASQPAPKGTVHLPKPHGALDPAKHYVVSLATNCGTIGIELAVKEAPKTAASFAYLVKRGFYDQLTFHRVVPGFVIQGGDPQGDGSGGPGYTVVERPPAGLQYTKGLVAMAKTGTEPPGASGSQFFIVTGTNIGLPPEYALLGRIVNGQSTVQAISEVSTSGPEAEQSTPTVPIVISKATLSEQQ
jgi:peptidyl-prolyl cis-trans isomerase B (cyclophilin B)